MAKILLLGAPGIVGVPNEVLGWISAYAQQGHEFIMGDTKTGDARMYKAISSLGLTDRTTIYTMNSVIENKYDLKVRQFDTLYDADLKKVYIIEHTSTDSTNNDNNVLLEIDNIEKEMDIEHNSEWYSFRDKRLMEECALAILILNKDEPLVKRVQSLIMSMNIRNKPCYTFQI